MTQVRILPGVRVAFWYDSRIGLHGLIAYSGASRPSTQGLPFYTEIYQA